MTALTPAPNTLADYLALVPDEHADKPLFIAVLSALLQPMVDDQAVLSSMPGLYDLDNAVGVQLDAVGLWVGRPRTLAIPIPNVYFSFDTAGLGFDQGVWKGPYDPTTGVVSLDDNTYRLVLRAQIGANNWDGTIPGAYSFLIPLLAPTGVTITDNQDMTMTIALTGPPPTPIVLALLQNQIIGVRPAGVRQIGL